MKDGRVWNEAGMWSQIERYRKEQRNLGLKGRCKEKALLRSMALQKEGFKTKLVTGKYKGGKHTWLEVQDPQNGNWYTDDPAQGIQYGSHYVRLPEYDAVKYEDKDWEIRDELAKQIYKEQNKRM